MKELWKILLALKTKTFCDLEEWTSFVCLKVKHFQKKKKKVHFLHSQWEGKRVYRKAVSEVYLRCYAICSHFWRDFSTKISSSQTSLTPSLLEVLLVQLLPYKFHVLLDRIWAHYFCQKSLHTIHILFIIWEEELIWGSGFVYFCNNLKSL